MRGIERTIPPTGAVIYPAWVLPGYTQPKPRVYFVTKYKFLTSLLVWGCKGVSAPEGLGFMPSSHLTSSKSPLPHIWGEGPHSCWSILLSQHLAFFSGRCMNGWMDGWMDGWSWLAGWMWIDGWTAGWLDGWMAGWMDGVDGWMWLAGWLDVGKWMAGWWNFKESSHLREVLSSPSLPLWLISSLKSIIMGRHKGVHS